MIDIIIPTCNSQNTIQKCLKSILVIKSISYNIILIDDGSIDNTPKINDKYSIKYSNVYSFHQRNKGVSVARNNGIKHAHGQWICFIDSDDYINAEKFIQVIIFYVSQRNDLIISNINFNGKIIGLKNNKITSDDIRLFLEDNYPLYGNELIHVIWNKIYKTSIIKQYNIKFPKSIEMGEDLIFVLRYLMHVRHNIIQTNISYYNYYIRTNSTTKSFEHHALKSRMMILKDIKDVYNKYQLSFNAFPSLRIKAIYSVLLNSLNISEHKMTYLKNEKEDIISKGLSKKLKYSNNIRNDILIFVFKQPSINFLLFFVYMIDVIRKIVFKIKY